MLFSIISRSSDTRRRGLLNDAVIATGSTDSAKLNDWISKLENHKTIINTVSYVGGRSHPLLDAYVVEIKDGGPNYVRNVRLKPEDIPAPIQ